MDEMLLFNEILQVFLDESSIIIEADKFLVVGDFSQELQVCGKSLNSVVLDSLVKLSECLFSILPPDDKLGYHWVVEG